MRKAQTAKTDRSQKNAPAAVPVEAACQGFVRELRKLNQPWNWVVRAFIRLLELDDAVSRWEPRILKYAYGRTPLNDGRWFLPDSDKPEHGAVPLGIVLEKVFEVTIRDKWRQGSQEKERLIPLAMLGPGALFGAFEFCDLMACIPSLRNYEVSAGSRAFKIAPKEGDSIRGSNTAFFKQNKTSHDWKEWKAGRADNDALIRTYLDPQNWEATILLLTQTPALLRGEERNLLNVIRNEAWHQSRHLREGYLLWLRHDLSASEFHTRKVELAAVSKFVRKVRLASTEQCVVFGSPKELDDYGPISQLVAGIAPDIGNRKVSLSKEDAYVPMLLHDTGKSSYLSLYDEVVVFKELNQEAELKSVQEAASRVVELTRNDCGPSCDITAVTKEGGRSDKFWRGAIQLTPQFPRLSCLAKVQEMVQGKPFEETAIVVAQHLLEETGSLIQALMEIRGDPKHIFVIGKPYSSNVRVWQRIQNLGAHVEDLFFEWKPGEFESAYRNACHTLWAKVRSHRQNTEVKRILILDDGGMLLNTVPTDLIASQSVAAVEQTSKGLAVAAKCGFPVVGVACSAAKKRLEPSIVAETVWRKLETILPQACAAKTMAVCGLGNVGEGLSEFIIERFKLRETGAASTGRRLLAFDLRSEVLDRFDFKGHVVRANEPSDVFEQAEVIFGCTGLDFMAGDLSKLNAIKDGRTRYLISCSSFDVEFASLLKQEQTELNPGITPFDLAEYTNPKNTAFLLPQAGFPITFDRAPSSAPIEQMQMTRGLLLAGLVQAAKLAKDTFRHTGVVPLDTDDQVAVVKAWREAKVREESWFTDNWFGKREERERVELESNPPETSPNEA